MAWTPKRIDELTEIVSIADDDILVVVQDWETEAKKIKKSNAITWWSGAVDSVNWQTWTVVLDADDISDTTTTNKFATSAELTQISTNTSNISTLDTDKADKSNVLELNNTTAFTPDADYEPATKKYVDDNAGSGWVTWPATSTDSAIVLFDWTTWDTIKDSVKTIVTSTTWLGSDDTTVPTSKAVADAIGSSWGWDMLSSTYDPTNVSADAFDMDNMVEWTTNKILTSAERTILGNTSWTNTWDEVVATGAEVDTWTDDTKMVTPKAIADSKVSYTDWTETLTNKTLTSPKINENVAVTSTATELNILDWATLSTTELNYVDWVTSSIQTQLGTKLENISEDTTPQLGGELDAWANSIGFTQGTATGDGTTTIDWGNGNKFKFTFGAQNETFTFTAPAKPGNFLLVLVQDATGSRTATRPATVKRPWGTAPTLTTDASAVDIVSFYYDGTNYYGQAGLDFS